MKKKNRIAMAVAALLLAGVFVFPIWSINLDAPQYPEGIGLNIRVNTIEGKAPQDLQNINGLNHYIGMQGIHPDSIPELKIMPRFSRRLILTGLLIAYWGNRKWLAVWLVFFVLLRAGGPGTTSGCGSIDLRAQPESRRRHQGAGHDLPAPLIGTKQLLNMRTTSMPHIGFFLAMCSMGLAALVWWRERPSKNAS
ncbi:MAG: hypothetical protein U5K31_06860 [Balneolaceae bacterium]|nr:hypothetical protein [Balneolaceae bacterium]